jgi:hypothetical protein
MLCARNCGYYGRPELQGLCSKCFKGGEEKNIRDPTDDLRERELKAIISAGGLTHDDCFDLDSLRRRAREVTKDVDVPVTERIVADFTCLIIGSLGGPVDLVVLLLHGLGQSNR